ncbi:MAG TPA: phage holin family protein [Candidatus Acidoferrales bacterium]|nr:phage holin family protein [Candidatus Acidoferrales bacterium]
MNTNGRDLYVKLIAASAAAVFGGLPVLVQALIILMAIDIATGLLAAYVRRNLTSDVSFRGMARKAIVLLIVAGGAWIEPAVELPIGEAVAGFYAAHEGLSILENAARSGLPIPEVLRDALAKLSPEAKERQEEKPRG